MRRIGNSGAIAAPLFNRNVPVWLSAAGQRAGCAGAGQGEGAGGCCTGVIGGGAAIGFGAGLGFAAAAFGFAAAGLGFAVAGLADVRFLDLAAFGGTAGVSCTTTGFGRSFEVLSPCDTNSICSAAG